MPCYVCIHGHFYQPPRENPWLEFIEIQDSATPWHDWNERISAECYRQNAASRILDNNGDIRKICNNYSRISFNIGPTLLSWMKEKAPRCYQAILDADVIGQKRFSGHGPALAQVYNHLIMPLANRIDKETQVKWAIEDFKSHFGRMPEGMWLAETAVDTETLEVLAEQGIKFTILAPKQASEIRPLDSNQWQDVKGEKIDTGRSYRCDLPSGRKISLFFYNGNLSQAIAFGGLLNDGGYFAKCLRDACPNSLSPYLSHVATDGESYGHHHPHGDMALAYCLETLDSEPDTQLTLYGEFLEKFPPRYAVRIIENSSWSCAHGVERWRSNCGCSTGTVGYHQKWREPLRQALDWLHSKLALAYEFEAAKYLTRPWEARNSYICVLLNRSRSNVVQWLSQNQLRPLSEEECITVLKLMETQRSSMLMYTSCGWFFDEISGIETTQILRYAARAMGLIHEITGLDYEIEFLRLLEKAPSNLPEMQNGRRVYELQVKTASLSFERLAAHYGMETLFSDTFASRELAQPCWEITGQIVGSARESDQPHSRSFTAGIVDIFSKVTWEKRSYIFAANHRGSVSLLCGVAPATEGSVERLTNDFESLRHIFTVSDEKKMVDLFGHNIFSLRHILADAQRTMLHTLLAYDALRIQESLKTIVSDYEKLFRYLTLLKVQPPSIISSAASISLSAEIISYLGEDIPDIANIRSTMQQALQWNIKLDSENIHLTLQRWLTKHMQKILDGPINSALMERVCDILEPFLNDFKEYVNLSEPQNFYYLIQKRRYTEIAASSETLSVFRKLGRLLKFSIEAFND